VQHRIWSGGPHGGLWIGVGTTERQAVEAHLATMGEAATLARDILAALPPVDRLKALLQVDEVRGLAEAAQSFLRILEQICWDRLDCTKEEIATAWPRERAALGQWQEAMRS
jgi:hypothetical protein